MVCRKNYTNRREFLSQVAAGMLLGAPLTLDGGYFEVRWHTAPKGFSCSTMPPIHPGNGGHATMDLLIDTSRDIGVVRPLHGINNGPVSSGALIDSSEFYKIAGFPFIRLHDTNWPQPREIDIPRLFPDFSADPDDPASYDFRRTDEYLDQCLATGAKIIYRLGVSIEHTKVKEYAHPPADFDKWATVCLNLVRHVNDGWANGRRRCIEYWEIWNEPDNQFFAQDRSRDPMWSGTPEQYFDLYAVTSRKLKKAYPELKIGGYAASRLANQYVPYFNAFLDRVAHDELPLDFFSWHRYADDPEDVYREAMLAQEGLDRIGYSHTLSICDEWNYIPRTVPSEARPLTGGSNAAARHDTFTLSSGHAGASFGAAVMARLHETRCAIAAHYDGLPTNYYCTIFDRYGYPEKAYYTFVKFREIFKRRRRLAVDGQRDGIYAIAAGDAKILSILITAFHSAKLIDLRLAGLDHGITYRVQKHLTDKTHCHALLEDSQITSTQPVLRFSLGEKATILLTLSQTGSR